MTKLVEEDKETTRRQKNVKIHIVGSAISFFVYFYMIVYPPSITKSAPVVKDEASDDRNCAIPFSS